MPSPEVIDLTLSDDEIQPDPIRSDQGPLTPTQATNRFRTSSTIPVRELDLAMCVSPSSNGSKMMDQSDEVLRRNPKEA